MAKTIVLILASLSAICGTIEGSSRCQLSQGTKEQHPYDGWREMNDGCIKATVDQVQTELDASLAYLAMGAHFGKDKVNRPGFSKFFFESASEERQHAIKLIEYLSMRGQLVDELRPVIKYPSVKTTSWNSGLEALQEALTLEMTVTNKIKRVIEVCECANCPRLSSDSTANDYHLVDWLTGDFLDEQYKGQRELAGRISTLKKMMEGSQGVLAEFLFDKELLQSS